MLNVIHNATMSAILRTASYFLFVFAALWGLILCFDIIDQAFGTIIAFISLIFFPFVLGLAPWYALFIYGDFTPLLVVYGGGIPAAILYALSKKID
jgi:uncharacterized membrane protein YuzA (DUF378 family)